ncbi:hypothetical protein KJ765_06005 [Candidatus Micrarchaeota archaeon]|nr:hypothetical protein [Candidatus Micrarchaeota archaeon]
MTKVSLQQLKSMASSLQQEPEKKRDYQMLPMFLPADISDKKGTGVVKVVTRQGFMNETIENWVLYNTYRGATVSLGVLALMTFPVNVYLSALFGIGAGFAYGKFKFKDFIINKQLRHRWLLEGT